MTNKNLRAINLFIILALTGTITAITEINKNLVNLEKDENDYFLYARKAIEGVNIHQQNVDHTHVQLTGFYSLPHHKDPNFNLLYSNTFVPDENEETNLQRWMAIQNNISDGPMYVPQITKFIYTLDSKELVVAYRRTAGSIYRVLFQTKSQKPIIDQKFLNFLNNPKLRRKVYAFMTRIMSDIQELGWHDCHIDPHTFHFKPFGAQFDVGGNITIKEDSEDNYYLIYTGFDSILPIESGCSKTVDGDSFSAAFADSGFLKNDFEPSEFENVTVSSLAVNLFTIEAYYLSALYESSLQQKEEDEIAIFIRNQSMNEPSDLETRLQKFYMANAPNGFKREKQFNVFVDFIVGTYQGGILYKSFTVDKPAAKAPVWYIMRTILELLSFFNSNQGEPFYLTDLSNAFDYLVNVFQKDTYTQHLDWETVFIKTEDNLNLEGHYRLAENDRLYWSIVQKMMSEFPTNRPSFAEVYTKMNENIAQYDELCKLFEQAKSGENAERDLRRRLMLV